MNKRHVTINGMEMELGDEIEFVADHQGLPSSYHFYQGRQIATGFSKIIVQCGHFYGYGDNFYDAVRMADAMMFAAHRTKFLPIITGRKNHQK